MKDPAVNSATPGRDDVHDIVLETSDRFEQLAGDFAAAAQTYANLDVAISLNFFGSDHEPFLNADLPALLIIESEYISYPGYHRTNDLTEYLGAEQGLEVMKMSVATLAQWVY